MRRKTKIGIWSGAAALVVLAVLAALPFLVPLDRFVPRIEELAREKTGLAVKIAHLRLFLLPTPHLTAAAISIGTRDAEVGEIAIYPQVGSLFGGPKVLRQIELDDVTLRDTLFAKLKLKGEKGESAAVVVQRLVLRRLRPILKGKPAGEWNLDVLLGEDLKPVQADLESVDGAFRARLVPEGRRWQVAATGKNWKLPIGPPLVFSALDAQGTLAEKTLDLPRIRAAFYGGTLVGRAKLEFPDRWTLVGDYEAKDVDVGPLARVFAPRQAVGGRLDTHGTFSAKAAKAEQLAGVLTVNGEFAVRDGVLYGFDLAGAAANVLSGGAKGGETRFERFSGSYHIVGSDTKLRNLVIASGALAAKGGVDITGPEQRLGGTVDVELRKTHGIVSVPLALAGTLKDPSVLPTKGTAIGAAVGTAVLPGIGTSLGASIGRFFEKKTEK